MDNISLYEIKGLKTRVSKVILRKLTAKIAKPNLKIKSSELKKLLTKEIIRNYLIN